MEIKAGSEVDIRQIGATDYELGVTKGEVDFKSAAGQKRIAQTKFCELTNSRLSNCKWKKLCNGSSLRNLGSTTHADQAPLLLKWRAPAATELVMQTLGGREQSWTLAQGELQREVIVPIGHHQMFLRAPGKTSIASTWKFGARPCSTSWRRCRAIV